MISLGKNSRSGIFRVGGFKPLDAGCQIASHAGRLCFAWQGELGKSRTQSSPGPGEERTTGRVIGIWKLPFRWRASGRGREADRGEVGGQELRPEDGGVGQSLLGWPSKGGQLIPSPGPAPWTRQWGPMGRVGMDSSTSLTGAVTQLLRVSREVTQAKHNDC